MAATQCIYASRCGEDDLLKFKPSIRMGKKGDLSDFETWTGCWCQTGWSEYFKNCWSTGMLWQSTVLRRLWHRITDATQQDANLWPAPKTERQRLELAKKHKGETEEFWNCVYGLMRQRWTFIWVMGKQKCGEKRELQIILSIQALSVKRGGGVVMAWACMAVSGTGRLNFTDDLMYDDSSRMNLEGYKTILPTNIQENANRFIGKCFILHQNNDPKHLASSVNEFIRAKKWKVLDCPSLSPDLIPIEHEFQHLKRRVKTETPQNKQQLELAALKAGKCISKDENKSLVMSMCHRLTAVIVRN